MDKYREADKCLTTSRRTTTRDQLEEEVRMNSEVIRVAQANIKEAKAALKLLDKNKEIETLINLINR